MNLLTITNDIKTLIDEFILTQNQLIETFKQSFPNIKDVQYLSDCPPQGEIKIGEEKWHFQRHGIGICFTQEKSGKVVDIHTGIFNNQIMLDSWRLIQYFESVNLKSIQYKNQVFNLENESDIEKIIELWDSFDGDYSNSDNKFKIIYFFKGKLYCKRRLVLAIIKDWIKVKNYEKLEQLNFTFSQDLTKSKYPLLIDIQESISYQPQKLDKNYFIQDNEKIIINGREYLLFKKWENRNIRDFVNLAKQIGYQIKEIVIELNQAIYKEKYNMNENTLFAKGFTHKTS